MRKKASYYESGRAFYQFFGTPECNRVVDEARIKADYTCSRCSKRGDTYTTEVIGLSDYFEKKIGVEVLEVVCNSCCRENAEQVDYFVTREMNLLKQYYFDKGLTINECAKLLNTTKGYVKSLLYVAIFKMRKTN